MDFGFSLKQANHGLLQHWEETGHLERSFEIKMEAWHVIHRYDQVLSVFTNDIQIITQPLSCKYLITLHLRSTNTRSRTRESDLRLTVVMSTSDQHLLRRTHRLACA